MFKLPSQKLETFCRFLAYRGKKARTPGGQYFPEGFGWRKRKIRVAQVLRGLQDDWVGKRWAAYQGFFSASKG
jgi:hypothetical protein